MKVKDVMHKGAAWIAPDMPLEKIARKMKKEDVGALPVGENDRLIGMVTDRDICCRGLANGRDFRKLTARDVMTKPILYCQAEQNIAAAVEIMRKAKVRRLPVINAKKRMVGILGMGDIAAKASQKALASAMKSVSAHHTR